jgi:hypothetical protein
MLMVSVETPHVPLHTVTHRSRKYRESGCRIRQTNTALLWNVVQSTVLRAQLRPFSSRMAASSSVRFVIWTYRRLRIVIAPRFANLRNDRPTASNDMPT